jgi:anaerobic magnesium-protoporphyrin IX monomethyl ester cyclase
MPKPKVLLAQLGRGNKTVPSLSTPLGLLYLAAHLRSKFAVDIRILDQRLHDTPHDRLIQEIIDFGPDIVGFGTMTPSVDNLPCLTDAVRQALPKSLIVLGGPHASAFRARLLETTSAHIVVVGEGELALENIVLAYQNGADFSGIPGLVWRDKDNEIVVNPGQTPMIDNLDDLPFPAYDLIDLEAYWSRPSMALVIPPHRYIVLYSSRGCPYGCIYCHSIFGRRFRSHSAERVVDEIVYFKKRYSFRDVEFVDDIFNLDKRRLLEFCELVRKRDIRVKISFPNALRADILTESEIDALVAAGLHYCGFSLETGSARLQKMIGKNLRIPEFVKSARYAVKKGVYSLGFSMLGFPTETREEMQETIDIMCGLPFHYGFFFTATPFPSTRLYEIAREKCPERVNQCMYDNSSFLDSPINLTDLPDREFFDIQLNAYRRFDLNPIRLFHRFIDMPRDTLFPPVFHDLGKRVKLKIRGWERTRQVRPRNQAL